MVKECNEIEELNKKHGTLTYIGSKTGGRQLEEERLRYHER